LDNALQIRACRIEKDVVRVVIGAGVTAALIGAPMRNRLRFQRRSKGGGEDSHRRIIDGRLVDWLRPALGAMTGSTNAASKIVPLIEVFRMIRVRLCDDRFAEALQLIRFC